jgi:hypothetical protein
MSLKYHFRAILKAVFSAKKNIVVKSNPSLFVSVRAVRGKNYIKVLY